LSCSPLLCFISLQSFSSFGRQAERKAFPLKKNPWSESASELYRPSDRRLSAKWLPIFCG
jgi:hypothetical protein